MENHLEIEKRAVVLGHPKLTCEATGSDGKWACKLGDEKKLSTYKLEPKWRFYYPLKKGMSLQEAMLKHCEQHESPPNKPYCFYVNDYLYYGVDLRLN